MNETQDDDENQENEGDNMDNADDENGDGQPKPAAAKKKRIRKMASTITKNLDTLNARLDTIPLPDPLFSKLNTIMGDVSSSNRLLMNILPSQTSDMSLILDQKFFRDTDDIEPNEYTETNEYDWSDDKFVKVHVPVHVRDKNLLRESLSGYLITNTPIDDDE